MSSETVCQVARSWVDVGSFHKRLFIVFMIFTASVRNILDIPSYNNHILFIVQRPFVTFTEAQCFGTSCFSVFRWLDWNKEICFFGTVGLRKQSRRNELIRSNFGKLVLWMTYTKNSTEKELLNKYVEWKTCTNLDNKIRKLILDLSSKCTVENWGKCTGERRNYEKTLIGRQKGED
jgi:hypothetical protein